MADQNHRILLTMTTKTTMAMEMTTMTMIWMDTTAAMLRHRHWRVDCRHTELEGDGKTKGRFNATVYCAECMCHVGGAFVITHRMYQMPKQMMYLYDYGCNLGFGIQPTSMVTK